MPPKGSKNTASHDTARCSWTDADDGMHVFGVEVVATDMKAATASGK